MAREWDAHPRVPRKAQESEAPGDGGYRGGGGTENRDSIRILCKKGLDSRSLVTSMEAGRLLTTPAPSLEKVDCSVKKLNQTRGH